MFSFNSFALLAGIILIIVFGNSLANEQEKNVGVLRILGLKRNKVMFIFFYSNVILFWFFFYNRLHIRRSNWRAPFK